MNLLMKFRSLSFCRLPLYPVFLLSVFLFPVNSSGKNSPANIQQILTQNCLECHGPDKNKRKGGLRLDNYIGATLNLDGYRAIVPGKPEQSKLIEVIFSSDEDKRMPPVKSGKTLARQEKEMLRQWIADGARYDEHWAYMPLAKTNPPAVTVDDWVNRPLDRFVLARLEKNNLKPSPEADRHTLIKRLYYDLLGLPAPLEAVDHFVNDKSPKAYEALVDRLLDSPHFGERWARHWLDKARYADSDGYEKDRPRPNAWRYRDWVVDAINRDLPFDQFTIEQIAGDLLPDPTPMHHLATAFHRQTLTNTEGGTDKEQWRVAAVMDRVETTGAVWLGLTVGCARCHTHKYDSISQDEYYQLFAFYNNGDETGFNVPQSGDANSRHKAEKIEYDKKIAGLEKQLEGQRQKHHEAFIKWQNETSSRLSARVNPPAFHAFPNPSASSKGFDFEKLKDKSFLVGKVLQDQGTYVVEASVMIGEPVTGFRLETLANQNLPSKGPGLAGHGNFVLNEFRVFETDLVDPGKKTPLKLSTAKADFSQKEWVADGAIDGVAKSGWAISPRMGQDHHITFGLGKPLNTKGGVQLRFELQQSYGSRHLIGNFRIQAMTGEDKDAIVPDNIRKVILTASGNRTKEQNELLWNHFATQDVSIGKIKKELDALRRKPPKAAVLKVRVITQRKGVPRKTHVLRRGEFKEPLHEVQPGTLQVLNPMIARSDKKTVDRLDFARWLVSPDNPLTPRVAINHIWSKLFGRGLVRTMNDFGVRGDPPTHPQLLDHLAQELLLHKWSRKGLIRYIVNSSTYRQVSEHRPGLFEKDPQNRLLYRQNRFRVEAEIIRDISLDAAGLLSRKQGGPCVYPPLPNGVTNLSYANSFKWSESKGDDRYRRGLYTFFKRTSPHPNLLSFDCPDSNVTCVERRISNTPLAALVTLNNQVFVEAAQGLARRMLELKGTDRDRLAGGFRVCVSRHPTDNELNELKKLLAESRSWYQANENEAKNLIGGLSAQGVATVENAAWVVAARVLLNLDEFLTRD